MMRPTFIMSFCFTMLVENARAFGGVLIGRIIADEDAMAIEMSMVGVPPTASSLSPIPEQTMAMIGMSRAAVALLLMKLERK